MVSGSSSALLIHTKLNRPRITAELVDRPRLYAALDSHRPLTAVVAPAGYGKTTLVSSWAERCGMRYAWLSLDASMSSHTIFVEYLLGAIEGLFPDIVHRLEMRGNHFVAGSYTAVARMLADELDGVDENFVLILDDYHLVNVPAVHRFMTELLSYPPAPLNLVIATRIDPPLPLAVMRAHNQLTEIRAMDLRFTTDETADYLHRALDQAVDGETLAILDETTEGWAAGLHLAALYLRNQKDVAGAATRFIGSNRLAIDYLAVEVLAKQSLEVQAFLFKTSILQRMCTDLCDAVLGVAPAAQVSQQTLERLERDDLFVVSLDHEQQWYRYHQLFQQLLRHKLRATFTSDEIAGLYRNASRWCAGHGLLDEAVTYALAGGTITEAISLIEQHRHAAINAENWQQLAHWWELVPAQAINAYPELLVLEAWVLYKRDLLTEAAGRLDLAEVMLQDSALTPAAETCLRSEIEVLRSQYYFRLADGASACAAARRALDYAPPTYWGVRGIAWQHLVCGTCLSEGVQPAMQLLDAAAMMEGNHHDPILSRLLLARCCLHWMGADMLQLQQTADELLWLARQHALPESLVWGHYFRGCAEYAQDNLLAAADDFLAVMGSRHHAPSFAFVQGAFGLAAVLQAQGNPESARTVTEIVTEYAAEIADKPAQQWAQAVDAYLAMAQDRHADILPTARLTHNAQPLVMPGLIAAPLIAVDILLRQATPAGLSEADKLLQRLEGFAVTTHNDFLRIWLLLRIAQLALVRGRRSEAGAALVQAVTLAQPGNVCRVFLEAEPALLALMDEQVFDGVYQSFVEQLRPAQPRPAVATTLPGGRRPAARQAPAFAQPRHPDLIELLTNREFEVLQLLAMRLTNKEIAHALGISTETVKQHTMNVFRKLHVENRRDAIVQARAMGFQFNAQNAL